MVLTIDGFSFSLGCIATICAVYFVSDLVFTRESENERDEF
jgi:hypothetical protein